MANPYGTWTPGHRPDAETGWRVTSEAQEVFRGLDRLDAALSEIMDINNPGPPSVLDPETALDLPSAVKTGENARRIIVVDLDDPETCWDLRAFMQRVRSTSWYAALGAPPVHGLLWIEEAQDAVVWWDRESDTQYVRITAAANGVIDDATPVLTDLRFKDGRIYLSGTGGAAVTIIDLVADSAWRVNASNTQRYDGTLGNFAGTAGYLSYNSTAIVHATVYALAVVRDPSLLDELGRPRHWWAAATADGVSVYSPVGDAIYDSTLTDDVLDVCLSPVGDLFSIISDATRDSIGWLGSIFGITADGFGLAPEAWINTGSGSEALVSSNAAVYSRVVGFPDRSAALPGSPLLIAGADEGLVLVHAKVNDNTKGGLIVVTASVQTPYMKGTRIAAYPLASVTDYSGGGRTLTNNGTVTFTAGVFGNAALFNGSSQYLNRTGDSGFNRGTGDYLIHLLAKSTSATNPGASAVLVDLRDAATYTDRIQVYFNTSGQLVFTITDDANATADTITSSADYHDGLWHQITAQISSGTLYLYVDNLLVGSTAISAAAASVDPARVGIGATSEGASFFAGQIDHLFIGKTVLTTTEIGFIYDAFRAALSGATTLLSNVGVTALRVDEDSGLVAVSLADGTVQVWDPLRCVVIATDAAPAGTLRDAAVRSRHGGDTQDLYIATSTRVELVQQDVRIGG